MCFGISVSWTCRGFVPAPGPYFARNSVVFSWDFWMDTFAKEQRA